VRVTISVTDRKGRRTEKELSAGSVTLGRDPRSDIVLQAPNVSSAHARVTVQDGRVLLEPLGATNGTFVNEKRAKGVQELAPGDWIGIGPFHIALSFGDDDAQAAPLPAARIIIEVEESGVPRRVVEVAGTEARIGRDKQSHVILQSKRVSLEHARIEVREDRLLLVDLGSANGTRVSGDRVGAPQRIVFEHDVEIGDAVLHAELAPPLPDDARMPRLIVLRVTEPQSDTRVIEVEQGLVSIGRWAQSDVVLSQARASTYHAKLHVREDAVLVEDNGSANGTKKNGVRLGAPEHVQPGDVLEIAGAMIVVEFD
jgi:pSer/pThr/pTyr-binding forkhead associated (FHA) protein